MASDDELDWKLTAKRVETVLADLEAAAKSAFARSRYRPGITALAVEVAALRAAIDGVARRQITVSAIWDEAYQLGRQAPQLPVQAPKARRHLTVVRTQDPPTPTTD
jgi:hypothetical protein